MINEKLIDSFNDEEAEIDELISKIGLDYESQGPVDCVCCEVKNGTARLYDDHDCSYFNAGLLIKALKTLNDTGFFVDNPDKWEEFWNHRWYPGEVSNTEPEDFIS